MKSRPTLLTLVTVAGRGKEVNEFTMDSVLAFLYADDDVGLASLVVAN